MTQPTVTSVSRLPGQTVTVTADRGPARTFLKTARVIFAPDLALLCLPGFAYRVPVHLFDKVRRALDLRRVEA